MGFWVSTFDTTAMVKEDERCVSVLDSAPGWLRRFLVINSSLVFLAWRDHVAFLASKDPPRSWAFLLQVSTGQFTSHLHDSIVTLVSMHVIAGCLTAHQLV
jgi:hypothetical protein